MIQPTYQTSLRANRRALTALRPFLLGLAACCVLGVADAQQDGPGPHCGNPDPPTDPCDCPPEGVNPVNVNSSDVQRELLDLEVFGGVGEHRLNWTRYGHSRLANGARWFGDGHIWRHSYQWEMVDTGANQLTVTYPDGTINVFTLNGGVFTSRAKNPDILTQSGNHYYLQRADGMVYHFVRVSTGTQTYCQLQDFQDSNGLVYSLVYDANNRLVLVTEPAGRWLRITYQDVTVNQHQFTTLYSQGSTPPAGWNQVNISNANTFRYLRYYGTDQGSVESHTNVAEVEFYDTANNKLVGTKFGSGPAWQNGNSTFDKAFDGDTGTFFDSWSPHFGFTGIDLGAGTAKAVGKIRFFPRAGQEARMNGSITDGGTLGTAQPSCRFEGSNVAPVTENVITLVEAGYGTGSNQVVTRNVQYNYTTLQDPVLSAGWLTMTSALYGDGSQATYTYQSVFDGQRPLLATADDPRMVGVATKIRYEFWKNDANVYGEIYAERDYTTNQILARFNNGSTLSERKVTYADGSVHTILLGGNANRAKYTDALGNATSYAYTSGGGGFLQTETNPLGHATLYTRDAQGRVLTATYADNTGETWTYDALGHMLTHQDERGYTTQWTRYSGTGLVQRIDYPDGGYELFTYNSFNQVLSHRQTNGGTEYFTYDARGLKKSWQDANGFWTYYDYNSKDLLALATDPLNHATNYLYNERGQMTKVTYADTNYVSYGYDVYGNQLSFTNELGKKWSAEYDTYRRKITATDPLTRVTQYWYDEPGANGGCSSCGSQGGAGSHLTTLILPSGKTTRFGYDLAWRKTSVITGYNTPAAATTSYNYDAADNLYKMTDPRGKATVYGYDQRERRNSVTDPLNHSTITTYDAAGNVASTKRADNSQTNYEYDQMGRRTKTTDALTQVTKMAYDLAGNLTTLTDGRNNAHGFTYDLRNRKTGILYPDNGAEGWTYDGAGNKATYTNRAGNVQTFVYDVRNRQNKATWNDNFTPEVTTTYDAAGRKLTLNNANSALTYTYNDAGEQLSETANLTGTGLNKTTSNTYDADGNKASLTYQEGTQLVYGYTTRNQLQSIGYAGFSNPSATYTYDLAGNRLSRTLETGVTATYAYNDANRLTYLAHAQNGTSFASFNYGYNLVNNRNFVQRDGGLGDVYGYDAIDEVTSVQYNATNPTFAPSSPQRTQGFSYDAVGNRQTSSESGNWATYQTNTLNQYTSVPGTTLTYDNKGNLTGPSNGYTGTFDAQNRLVSLVLQTGLGSFQATTRIDYAYDARNRRVLSTYSRTGYSPIPAQKTARFYEGWNLLTEYYCDTAIQSQFSFQAGYGYGPQTDELLTRVVSGAPVYYHQDGLGNVACLTGTNGQVVERYSYDVFGMPVIKNAAGTTLAATQYGNRFLYTGREWVPDINAYDYRNRFYSPLLGKFVQTDPIRFKAGDVNLYRYVLNNPTNFTDPDGLDGSSLFPYGTNAVPTVAKKCCKKIIRTGAGLGALKTGLELNYKIWYLNRDEYVECVNKAFDDNCDCEKGCDKAEVAKAVAKCALQALDF